jgi:hypothetical protein
MFLVKRGQELSLRTMIAPVPEKQSLKLFGLRTGILSKVGIRLTYI